MLISSATFRCDASAEIGSGHVMRCLAFASYLAERGVKVKFLTSEETLHTVPVLGSGEYKILPMDAEPENTDLLIVDHYNLGVKYEQYSRAWARRIFVIDDLADRQHDCDILLDQTYGRDPLDYRDLVPEGCKLLIGPEYAILRQQFSLMRQESLDRRIRQQGNIKRILIFLSGTDPANYTGKITGWLESLSTPVSLDIVINSATAKQDLKKLAAQSKHNISVYERVSDMAAMMAKADLAIGAGGTASWERCCLGLPAILIIIADNQVKIAEGLERAEAVVSMGCIDSFEEAKLVRAVADLQNNPQRVLEMSLSASRICDGGGLKKIESILYG